MSNTITITKERYEKLRKAIELSDRMMDRDGISDLKGIAWTDNERDLIKEAYIDTLKIEYGG